MPHYRCCVGGCDNDNRNPEKIIKRGHVEGELRWHYMTKDPAKWVIWEANIGKGRQNFKATDHQVVCSNHFQYGKPTFSSPNPTIYLRQSDNVKKSPKKRPLAKRHVSNTKLEDVEPDEELNADSDDQNSRKGISGPCIKFDTLTRDADVKLFTGLPNVGVFKAFFEFLQPQAITMVYWRGPKQTSKSPNVRYSVHGNKKLSLEDELFLVMQRLRLGLLTEYLAHAFQVSPGQVSSITFTWLRLMSLELAPLSHGQTESKFNEICLIPSGNIIRSVESLLTVQSFSLKPRQASKCKLSVGVSISITLLLRF